jgi:hypothetical protein
MKKTLLFALILILAACTSAPQNDSPLPPGEGPGVRDTPALTPTPVAVDGIATIDGIHYIFDEAAQNWVALPELDADFARVMETEDGRIVALDEKNAEKYSLDMATGEWVELKVSYSADVLAEMDENAKLAAARQNGRGKVRTCRQPDGSSFFQTHA